MKGERDWIKHTFTHSTHNNIDVMLCESFVTSFSRNYLYSQ